MNFESIVRVVRGPWLPPRLGKTPYLWSSSLGFFLWKYLVLPAAPFELAAALLTVLLFLPLYFASFWTRDRRLLPYIAVTVLLGALWAPHNFGAGTFFIYACGMCAGLSRPRDGYRGVTLILALGCALTAALGLPLNFLIPTLIVGGPVGFACVIDAEQRRARDQLLRKQEEVEHLATIAERERISRDLHDLLGHTLSLITLKAELAGKLIGRDQAACHSEIRDIERSAREALAEVRAAVTGYRQSGLAHELATARISLAAANVELTARMAPLALPATVENVLSLALREAVTNIVRHAGATRCAVELALEGELLVLRIEDDGRARGDAAAIAHGNGLSGMRERLAGLGGRLALRVGRGLALELTLPMGAKA